MSSINKGKTVRLSRADLQVAWAILENLAVSLDQIGGTYATGQNGANGAAKPRALQEALAGYFKPELVRNIRDARARLGRYISDADAEKLSERIPYWDYCTVRARDRRNA